MINILYEKLKGEKEKLLKRQKELQEQIRKYPEGFFICARNGKYFKWYNSDGHKKEVIPKDKEKLAEALAAKRYLSCMSDDISQEIICINTYLEKYNSKKSKADQFISQNEEIERLIKRHFKTISGELEIWAKESYPKNPNNPEGLIHKTIGGYFVRSKSEQIIDRFLTLHKIPFRYECEFYLDGRKIYPDFIIRHPKTGKWYIWEHFGLMDDQNYVKKTANKMQLYINNGYIPGVNFIATFETKEQPLTIEKIEKIIQEMFLE